MLPLSTSLGSAICKQLLASTTRYLLVGIVKLPNHNFASVTHRVGDKLSRQSAGGSKTNRVVLHRWGEDALRAGLNSVKPAKS